LILANKTYILPIFDYCSPIWSPNTIGDIERIESVQRMFTKKLLTFSNDSYSDRLLKSGLITPELRRVHADLILCFKIVHGLPNLVMTDFLCVIIIRLCYTREHIWRLRASKPRLDSRRHFFAYRTVIVWNKLSQETVCAYSLHYF